MVEDEKGFPGQRLCESVKAPELQAGWILTEKNLSFFPIITYASTTWSTFKQGDRYQHRASEAFTRSRLGTRKTARKETSA